jgi:hypothetical protein
VSLTDEERLVRALPARPVESLLNDLAEAAGRLSREEAPALPRVTLHLVSGRDISGVVLSLNRDRHGETNVLLRQELGRHEPAAVCFAPLRSIEAVSVFEAARFAMLISRGQFAGPVEAAPTRLEARRLLEANRAELSQLLGTELEWKSTVDVIGEGEPLRSLVELSREAVAAVRAAARDELGKAAISKTLKVVAFEQAGTATVARSEGRLTFTAPFDKGRAGRRSETELTQAVEAAF